MEEACLAARQLHNLNNRRAAVSSAQAPLPQLNQHREVVEGCSTLLPPSPRPRQAVDCSTMPRIPVALYSAAAAETPTLGRRVCLGRSQRKPEVCLAARPLPSQLKPHRVVYCAFPPCPIPFIYPDLLSPKLTHSTAAASTNPQTSSSRILPWVPP